MLRSTLKTASSRRAQHHPKETSGHGQHHEIYISTSQEHCKSCQTSTKSSSCLQQNQTQFERATVVVYACSHLKPVSMETDK